MSTLFGAALAILSVMAASHAKMAEDLLKLEPAVHAAGISAIKRGGFASGDRSGSRS